MRFASPSLLVAALASIPGCAAAPRPPPPPPLPAANAEPAPPTAGRLRVRAVLARSVPFPAATLGRNDALVSIVIDNQGASAVRVGELRVAFSVRRGDVAFPCEPTTLEPEREASTLRPGASLQSPTTLRCWTPLAGRYEAQAAVTLAGSAVPFVAPFRFEVDDPAQRAARAYAARPGLYVIAGGDARSAPTAPTTREPSAGHGYAMALAFVNAGTAPLSLPPARVSLDVYRAGDPYACTGEAASVALPTLPVGDVVVRRVPVTCLRDRRGDYEIRASVEIEGGPAIEAGRVRVKVSDADVVTTPPSSPPRDDPNRPVQSP